MRIKLLDDSYSDLIVSPEADVEAQVDTFLRRHALDGGGGGKAKMKIMENIYRMMNMDAYSGDLSSQRKAVSMNNLSVNREQTSCIIAKN